MGSEKAARMRASHSSDHSKASLENWLVSGVSPVRIPIKKRSAGRDELGLSDSSVLMLTPRVRAIVPTRQEQSPSYVEPSTRPVFRASIRAGTSAGDEESTAQISSRIGSRLAPLRSAPLRLAPLRLAPL